MSFGNDRASIMKEFLKSKRCLDMLFYDFFQEKGLRIEKENSPKKVLFLDIDGVLTDYKGSELKIEEDRVKRLKKIIDETGAKIVLYSKRRKTYETYKKDPSLLDDHDVKEMKQLQDMFDKYGISVVESIKYIKRSDFALMPFQIREWLLENPQVESFAILSVRPWIWGWLLDNTIRTFRRSKTNRYVNVFGLEDSDVKEAIFVLNRYENEEKE